MMGADVPTAARVQLRGISWNHTRGVMPLHATAQRFAELHPGVEIAWTTRSLQEFADQSLGTLARAHDLMVIDHPWIGHAAAHGHLLPLDGLCDADFLADQAAHSVGLSHASYVWADRLWALPIDSAAPVASWRPDLAKAGRFAVPTTWSEVLALARRGQVVVAAIPVDALMLLFMFANAHGENPFTHGERFLSHRIGIQSLESPRELIALCPRACLDRNPIATYEAMASGDDHPYCPAAFGYSNYARDGYADSRLRFGEPVRFGERPLVTTLGGAGLAISAHTAHPALAAAYAAAVAAPRCQRTIYAMCGGQPGHRLAWQDSEVNRWSDGYFARTLPALDRGWLRPRYDGYLGFQDRAGEIVHSYLRDGGTARQVLERLEMLYQESRGQVPSRAGSSGGAT